jgi:hypothetical protein
MLVILRGEAIQGPTGSHRLEIPALIQQGANKIIVPYEVVRQPTPNGDATMNNNKKQWSDKNVQPPVGKVVWDRFDEEAARDASAVERANQMRVRRPRRVK